MKDGANDEPKVRGGRRRPRHNNSGYFHALMVSTLFYGSQADSTAKLRLRLRNQGNYEKTPLHLEGKLDDIDVQLLYVLNMPKKSRNL